MDQSRFKQWPIHGRDEKRHDKREMKIASTFH